MEGPVARGARAGRRPQSRRRAALSAGGRAPDRDRDEPGHLSQLHAPPQLPGLARAADCPAPGAAAPPRGEGGDPGRVERGARAARQDGERRGVRTRQLSPDLRARRHRRLRACCQPLVRGTGRGRRPARRGVPVRLPGRRRGARFRGALLHQLQRVQPRRAARDADERSHRQRAQRCRRACQRDLRRGRADLPADPLGARSPARAAPAARTRGPPPDPAQCAALRPARSRLAGSGQAGRRQCDRHGPAVARGADAAP